VKVNLTAVRNLTPLIVIAIVTAVGKSVARFERWRCLGDNDCRPDGNEDEIDFPEQHRKTLEKKNETKAWHPASRN